MNRDEALKRAEQWAELGALRGVLVFIMCFVLIFLLIAYRQYLLAVMVAALMVLAVYVMIRSSQYAEVYREERVRLAAESACISGRIWWS